LLNTFWPPIRVGAGGQPLPPPPASRRWLVVLISSTLFALVHFNGPNPEVLPIIFTLALWLGYVYERTGNLWACMIMHAGFNAVSTLLVLIPDGPVAKHAAAASLTLWHWFV
jgi:membrane protease YdiL (CAAX protease family)